MRCCFARWRALASMLVIFTLPALAQGGLPAPETPQYDENAGEWHWTVMTGEGNYGYIGQYQRRAKATTSWPSSWTDFLSIDAGDGTTNVERRVEIPAASFDRNVYDYRIRVYYQINPGIEGYDDSAWTTTNTLEGYEPTAPAVTVSASGNNLVCAWTLPTSGAQQYEVRSRDRALDTTTWSSWITAAIVSASATRRHTLSTSDGFRQRDWQCGVTTVQGTTKSSEAFGSFDGAPVAVEAEVVVTIAPAPAAAPQAVTPTPVPVTCLQVSTAENGISVGAAFGLASGIQCQKIDNAGIGIQSVIDAGYIAAVDVWGYVEQGAEVCFQERGSLTFLDARTAPRTVSFIEHYLVGDKTCTWITAPGSIVLVPLRNDDSPQATVAQVDARDLTSCMVTTTTRLNFRGSPGGDPSGNAIGRRVTLTAIQRTDDWFYVDNMGVYGWISAVHVSSSGSCD